MFIEDVIAKRRQGLLAGSVPELMLSYVARLDTPADPSMRQRAGLEINGSLVQKALKVLALASHRQGAGSASQSPEAKSPASQSPGGQAGRPGFQPMEFPLWLAERALAAADGMDLQQRTQRQALLEYLLELNLLRHPGADLNWLRFPRFLALRSPSLPRRLPVQPPPGLRQLQCRRSPLLSPLPRISAWPLIA